MTPLFPRGARRLALLAAVASMAVSTMTHAETVRQVLPGAPPATAPQEMARVAAPAAGDASEVERFCSNIADAARDRRYALQAAEMKQLQADLDARMTALDEKKAEYETWLKRREVFLARAQDGIVKIYAGMKPDAAAERLAMVNVDLAAAILMKLDSRKASVILNEMDDKAAAALTSLMASAARRVDPS
ncbi:MAG TPA: MotE family protein [Mesorhizobium sp.]